MKKAAVCVLAGALLFALCGCGGTEVRNVREEEKDISMFVRVEETLYWEVVYHSETKVMYAVSTGGYNRGTFTVLVNPDGTPMLYEG